MALCVLAPNKAYMCTRVCVLGTKMLCAEVLSNRRRPAVMKTKDSRVSVDQIRRWVHGYALSDNILLFFVSCRLMCKR